MLTSQQSNPMAAGFLSSTLEFEVDSLILLYNVLYKGKRQRALEILKMRGTAHPQKTCGLEIKHGGMVIDADKIVEVNH